MKKKVNRPATEISLSHLKCPRWKSSICQPTPVQRDRPLSSPTSVHAPDVQLRPRLLPSPSLRSPSARSSRAMKLRFSLPKLPLFTSSPSPTLFSSSYSPSASFSTSSPTSTPSPITLPSSPPPPILPPPSFRRPLITTPTGTPAPPLTVASVYEGVQEAGLRMVLFGKPVSLSSKEEELGKRREEMGRELTSLSGFDYQGSGKGTLSQKVLDTYPDVNLVSSSSFPSFELNSSGRSTERARGQTRRSSPFVSLWVSVRWVNSGQRRRCIEEGDSSEDRDWEACGELGR